MNTQEWTWVPPKNRDELLTRLAEARDLNVPERERENLCAVAYTVIVGLREDDITAACKARRLAADRGEACPNCWETYPDGPNAGGLFVRPFTATCNVCGFIAYSSRQTIDMVIGVLQDLVDDSYSAIDHNGSTYMRCHQCEATKGQKHTPYCPVGQAENVLRAHK